MALVTTQVRELAQERRVLLDRLATLGLGGPLFSSASLADSSENVAEEPIDPEAEEIEKLMKQRDRIAAAGNTDQIPPVRRKLPQNFILNPNHRVLHPIFDDNDELQK